MTENQKSILEKLSDEGMTVGDLCAELHMTPSSMRKVLNNMVRSQYIKEDAGVYSIAINYSPVLSWNFKPLINIWGIK
jgi:DNA-binding IclR family transcriptional regulator